MEGSCEYTQQAVAASRQGWSSSLGVGRGANISSPYIKYFTGPRTWTDSLDKRPKLWKMDVQFGAWNVRSLYRAGSLMTAAREI
jgi:hypothetical protein